MADGTHIHPAGASVWTSTDNITYTQAFDVKSFEGFQAERGESDDTTLNSPNKLILSTPGWIKGGEVMLEVYFVKAFINTHWNHFTAGDGLYYRWLFPVIGAEANGSKFEHQGYYSKMKPFGKQEKGNDDKIASTLSIKITTLPTLTQGS